jgi:hypothetical protein
MSSGPKLLEQMRATKAGWAERDFSSVLEYYGCEVQRHARHGAIFRHPLLASHPDLEVRRDFAYVMIPKSRSSKEYVAENLIRSVDALLAYTQGRS